MDFKNIPLGTAELPNVLIEIPAGSANKYEFDEGRGYLVLDYVFSGGFCFPFNYGSLPQTRAEDNDPLDAIVLSSQPIAPLTVVQVKPLGIIKMKDRGEQDNKLVTVAAADPLARKLDGLAGFSEKQKQDYADFFREVGRQKDKSIVIEEFADKAEAIKEVKRCMIL